MATILGTEGADTITGTVTVTGWPLATAGADSISRLGGNDTRPGDAATNQVADQLRSRPACDGQPKLRPDQSMGAGH